jgi:hypothetical protein
MSLFHDWKKPEVDPQTQGDQQAGRESQCAGGAEGMQENAGPEG